MLHSYYGQQLNRNVVIRFNKVMKILVLLVLFPLIILCQSKTGTIRGKVIDADDNQILIGANILVSNTLLGAATDINGNYFIKDVPLGKHILKCFFVFYSNQKDTVEITGHDLDITKDFYLTIHKIPILMPDSIKRYQDFFSNYNPKEILHFNIDSISNDYSKLFLTFVNKTRLPVYLIEDLHCFNTVKIIVKNETGESIKENLSSDCFFADIILPEKDNLIKIAAFDSISFPPVTIQNYDLKNYPLPKGKYFISVKYETKDIKYLPAVSGDELDYYYKKFKNEIEVINQATRGVYFSENEITINK